MKQVAIYGVSDDLIEVEVSDETGEVTESREYNTERGEFFFATDLGTCLTVTIEYGENEWEIGTKMSTYDRGSHEDADQSFTVTYAGRPGRLDDPMVTVSLPDTAGWRTDLTED